MRQPSSNSRTRKWSGPQDLGGQVAKLVSTIARKRGLASHDLMLVWPDLVGEPYDRVSLPEKLIWPRQYQGDDAGQGAKLAVRVEPAFAMQFQQDWPRLRARLNTCFGYDAITGLSIMQGPVHHSEKPEPTPEPDAQAVQAHEDALETIEDDGLRRALATLGAMIEAENTKT